MRRLSLSATAGIGAVLAVSVVVLAALGGHFGTTVSGDIASGSPTAIRIGAIGSSGSASGRAQTPDNTASAGSPSSPSPTSSAASPASSAGSAITAPPGSSPTPASPTPASQTDAPTDAPTDTPTLPGTTPDPAAPVLDITALPDTVTASESVTLAAVTAPGASCQAKLKFHGGKASLAPGLAKKQTADSAGNVSWTWVVDSDAQAGTGTVTVSCNLKGHGSSKSKVLVVV